MTLTKLIKVAKASTKSTVYIFLGNCSSWILVTITSILIARLLGPWDYGLYKIAFTVPTLFISLSDLGISPALTRFSAKFLSEGREKKAASLIKTGIVSKTLLSLFFSTLLFLISDYIAIGVLHRPKVAYLIRLSCLILFAQAILASIKETYIGLDKSDKYGFLLALRALAMFASSPLLIMLGLGLIGAILGDIVSVLLTLGVGVTLLLLDVRRILSQHRNEENIDFAQGFRVMITYGIPICLSSLIEILIQNYNIIILALLASELEVGNYSIAISSSTVITLLTFPIVTSLFPAFSKISVKEDRESVDKMFKFSVKYLSLVVVPSSLALVLFSQELTYFLLPGFKYTPRYLAVYSLTFLNTLLGMRVIPKFLNGQGNTKATFRINLLWGALSLVLTPVMTMLYGVSGMILSVLAMNFVRTIYGLHLVRKYQIGIDWKSSVRTVMYSVSCALLVYVLLSFINFNNPIYTLLVGGPLYLTVLLVFAPIFRAINNSDIENLRELTSSLPLIHPITNGLLNFEEKILSVTSRISTEHPAQTPIQ